MENLPTLERLREVAEQVGREIKCRLIVLFGSVGRGDSRCEDVDLAVLPARGVTLDTIDFTNRLIQALRIQQIDVSDLSRADPLLLMLVAKEGIPLYEGAQSEFACFVSLASRRYWDTRKFREMERQDLERFAAGEGNGKGKGKREKGNVEREK